jgi:outer membrane lipoprotein-sorting protein
MIARTVSTCLCMCLIWSSSLAAESGGVPPRLSVEQIVERNATARGGLKAWRAVQTLSWTGKMDAGGDARSTLPVVSQSGKSSLPAPRSKEQVQLPFVYEMERPRKSRLEIQLKDQTAVQVYDGTQGWKIRPFLNRQDVETFTAEETQAAVRQADLDGLLIDSAAKTSKVELAGVESVEGHPAYKLKVTPKGQQGQYVWVDAKTFLELRIEGQPRRLDGRLHAVSLYLSDYRNESGLIMPHHFETRVEGIKQTEKILIERVQVNPKIDEGRFAKPT